MLPIPKPSKKQRRHNKAGRAPLPTFPTAAELAAKRAVAAAAAAAKADDDAAAAKPERSRSRSPAGRDAAKQQRDRSRSPRNGDSGNGDAEDTADDGKKQSAAAAAVAPPELTEADKQLNARADVVLARKNGFDTALTKCAGKLTRNGWEPNSAPVASQSASAAKKPKPLPANADAAAPAAPPLSVAYATDAREFNTARAFWAQMKPTPQAWKMKNSTNSLRQLVNAYGVWKRLHTPVSMGAVLLAAVAGNFAPPLLWPANEGIHPRHFRLSEKVMQRMWRQKWAKLKPPAEGSAAAEEPADAADAKDAAGDAATAEPAANESVDDDANAIADGSDGSGDSDGDEEDDSDDGDDGEDDGGDA